MLSLFGKFLPAYQAKFFERGRYRSGHLTEDDVLNINGIQNFLTGLPQAAAVKPGEPALPIAGLTPPETRMPAVKETEEAAFYECHKEPWLEEPRDEYVNDRYQFVMKKNWSIC